MTLPTAPPGASADGVPFRVPFRVPFLKGHGAHNDFVVLHDPEGALDLTAAQVRMLAERTGGLGADGVIRLVPTAQAGIPAPADAPAWFMDYRNADGSLAQMCGNGTRVFAACLDHLGILDPEAGPTPIWTRAGMRTIEVLETPDGHGPPVWQVRTGMARAEVPGTSRDVRIGDRTLPALDVDMGNPHAVAFLPSDLALNDLDLTAAPPLDPAAPEGANVEFVVLLGERHAQMRVHERGSGETLACGTGACAVAVAAALRTGDDTRQPWRVDLPGGTLTVGWTEDGEVTLSGPAQIVAEGTLWL